MIKSLRPIKRDGKVGIGLSKATLSCGLRFLMRSFITNVVMSTHVGLRQLLLNSFFHINNFYIDAKNEE